MGASPPLLHLVVQRGQRQRQRRTGARTVAIAGDGDRDLPAAFVEVNETEVDVDRISRGRGRFGSRDLASCQEVVHRIRRAAKDIARMLEMVMGTVTTVMPTRSRVMSRARRYRGDAGPRAATVPRQAQMHQPMRNRRSWRRSHSLSAEPEHERWRDQPDEHDHSR